MRTTRLAALAALLSAAVLLPPAQAALPAAQPSPAKISALSTSLQKQLGTRRTAGAYLDGAGRLVIPVTDAAAARTVRAAGATPRLVAHSAAQLSTAQAGLDRSFTIPGTATSVDPVTNKVVITADVTVRGARLKALKAAAAGLGSMATIERTANRITTKLRGGDAAYYGDYQCSVGFNVVSGSTYYFLTAGHCGNDAVTWYSDYDETVKAGTTYDSQFPTNDYALVKYSITSHPGTVNYNSTTKDITSYGTPTVGQTVYKSGGVSGTTSGSVTALNSTVTFDDGSKVYGTIKTTACADGGDSGGPLFSGSVAYGMLSGGDGDCDSNPSGPNWFQPVGEALSAYGVSIY